MTKPTNSLTTEQHVEMARKLTETSKILSALHTLMCRTHFQTSPEYKAFIKSARNLTRFKVKMETELMKHDNTLNLYSDFVTFL